MDSSRSRTRRQRTMNRLRITTTMVQRRTLRSQGRTTTSGTRRRRQAASTNIFARTISNRPMGNQPTQARRRTSTSNHVRHDSIQRRGHMNRRRSTRRTMSHRSFNQIRFTRRRINSRFTSRVHDGYHRRGPQHTTLVRPTRLRNRTGNRTPSTSLHTRMGRLHGRAGDRTFVNPRPQRALTRTKNFFDHNLRTFTQEGAHSNSRSRRRRRRHSRPFMKRRYKLSRLRLLRHHIQDTRLHRLFINHINILRRRRTTSMSPNRHTRQIRNLQGIRSTHTNFTQTRRHQVNITHNFRRHRP